MQLNLFDYLRPCYKDLVRLASLVYLGNRKIKIPLIFQNPPGIVDSAAVLIVQKDQVFVNVHMFISIGESVLNSFSPLMS